MVAVSAHESPVLSPRDLDLAFLRAALVARDGLDAATADRALDEYRGFLAACKAAPHARLVPSSLADVAWHRHILHTRRYAADCARLFGGFLHHEQPDADVERAPTGDGWMVQDGPSRCYADPIDPVQAGAHGAEGRAAFAAPPAAR